MWLVAVSLLLVQPWTVEAQTARPPRFDAGIYAGGSVPLGESKDSSSAGYHVGGIVDTTINRAMDVTIEVAFNKLGDKTLSEGATFREVGTNALSGTAGVMIHSRVTSGDVRGRKAISPYVSAAVGAYRFRFDYVCRGLECTGPERDGRSETRWGLNAGGGATVRLKAIRTFFQVSYHAIFPNRGQSVNTTLLLASFGLRLPVSSKCVSHRKLLNAHC
jgi:opacity protein-like surface antigen